MKPAGSIGLSGDVSSLRQILPQIIAVGIKNILLLGYGMALGLPTILIPKLSGGDPSETIYLDDDDLSWIGSLNAIFVPLGCLFSGKVTNAIGRKKTMIISNIPFIVAYLLLHFSNEEWHVFLALSVIGFTGGFLEAPVLTYVAEITQPHIRGILMSTSTASISLGTLIEFILGSTLPWRTGVLICCTVPILCIVLLMMIPDSPVWLICENRDEDAKKSLAWLRGWTNIESIEKEFQELNQRIKIDGDTIKEYKTILYSVKMFGKRKVFWPFTLVSVIFFVSHFNGNTTLNIYAVSIFAAMGSPLNNYYATVIMGAVELLGCLVFVLFTKFIGKRILTLVSLVGAAACFVVTATYGYIINVTYQSHVDESIITENYWVPATLLILSAFLTFAGIRVMPWILLGEILPVEARAVASGLGAGVGYIFSFISNKTFLSIVSLITLPGILWFYGAVGFLGALLLYVILPETEGKTLFEIEDHFAGRRKLSNRVGRQRNMITIKNTDKG